MKELSIEEKARRYDGAIKRLEDIETGKCQKTFMFTEGLFDYIFPELAESEDERIRKALIRYFTLSDEHAYNEACGVSYRDIVAWLEKQAQNSAWTEKDKKMLKWVIGYLENKMLNTPIGEERIACKNAIAWFKKLEGEQKPADKVELKFKVGDTVKDPYGDLYHITEIIDDSYKTDDGRFILFKNQEVYTLFNFTAWSEEDSRLLDNCISLIEDIDCTEEEQNWLKGIKDRVQPQSQWKPSDEQMKALSDINLTGCISYAGQGQELVNLYNDLKKLKG